jgi:hypothetical protein
VRTDRPAADIPTPPLTLSLVLAAVLRLPSLLQLEAETQRAGWQRLVGWARRISDDAFAYALERFSVEDLRQVLVDVNRRLKANKQFERAKIRGLLVVSLDANEQFKSRSRCCAQCSQRRITVTDPGGEQREVTEYDHRQVYAQLGGPEFSVVLDVEPIRPGEDEAQAALRMLGRMRRMYGPRFFDVVTVDAWYAQGPWLRAVQQLGWGVVCVLKQERFEVFQEASVLRGQEPSVSWESGQRRIQAWAVKDLTFTEPALGPVRVVMTDERWQEVHQAGGQRVLVPKESHWRWMVTRPLDGYDEHAIWQIGPGRWRIENHVFNTLTQHYHLTHCPHHHPVAILAWLLILVLGFVVFGVFAQIHGKLLALGHVTRREITEQLRRALEREEELEPLWSG